MFALLKCLSDEVAARRLAIPLSFTNLYETQKVNDPRKRYELARVQSFLSCGLVFRGRHKRLEVEIGDFIRAAYDQPAIQRSERWFLSHQFIESAAEVDDNRIPPISEKVLNFIRNRPAYTLFDYLVNVPEDIRRLAILKYSEGTAQLRQRIEARRKAHAGESLEMRRRIYSAIQMIEELDLILNCARAAGAQWESVDDIGEAHARQLMQDVPTYYIEREIAVRLEAQNRRIAENDLRDMQAFCSVLPYSDWVVAEKQFSSLAIQAGLDKRYGTRIVTNLLDLQGEYPVAPGTAEAPIAPIANA